MPSFAKAASILMVPVSLAVLGMASYGMAPGTASAQTAPAPAAQPCSGTFCDLYYGGKGSTSTTSSPTSLSTTQQGVPVTVPNGNIFSGLFSSSGGTQTAPSSTAASNAQQGSAPFVRVVGGRPANERCTGTLCDLFHSGDDPSPQQKPAAQQQASAAPAVEPVTARPARKYVPTPQAKPICHNDRDPWQCYR